MDVFGKPDAPDYAGAAEASGAASRGTVRDQTYANRPTQNTPWGQQSWETGSAIDPATGEPVTTWTQNQTLNPLSQTALDNTLTQQANRTGLSNELLDRNAAAFRAPIQEPDSQWGQLGDYDERRQQAEDAAYGRSTSRLDPQWEQNMEGVEVKLRNQGLQPGDQAYDRAMQQANFAQTDAYEQARMGATAEGRQESQLAYGQQLGGAEYANTLRQAQTAEEMQNRGWTLNEINAINSGQQVAAPQMPGFNASAAAQPTDYLGAAQMQGQQGIDAYNAQQAGLQGMFSGLGSLGSAGITKWG